MEVALWFGSVLTGFHMYMSSIGYGYSRADVMNIAAEYLSSMNRHEPFKPLTDKWFYNFLKRWPEWKPVRTLPKPSGLEMIRARSSNPEIIAKYYAELSVILEKYNLIDRPECIYNVDEKGINSEHKPPNVVGGQSSKPQALISPKGTTTVTSAGNANGMSIPPYFVFKGARFLPELLTNSVTGSADTVSATGWSNSQIFKEYLDHFLRFSQGQGTKLILFDGHRSHVNPDTIAWAQRHDTVLFVLPPHTSWILQPLDVACFGPFSRQYHFEAKIFMSQHPGQVISRYNVAEIVSRAYCVGLSPSNLKSAFQKCGIYPFNPSAYDSDKIGSHALFSTENEVHVHVPDTCPDTLGQEQETLVEKFLNKKIINAEKVRCTFVPLRKKKTLSSVIAGKAVTEESVVQDITSHISQQKPMKNSNPKHLSKGEKTQNNGKGKGKAKKGGKTFVPPFKEITTAGPSGVNQPDTLSDMEDDHVDESDCCCICKSYNPPQKKNLDHIVIVNWGQYTNCSHWTHLSFCAPVRVLRRHSIFLCPHCDVTNEQ